ncbi:MAG: signal peptidase I [Oscillospiraceae bacterium]|nr:signal peptidase I [Oscillospiraceae bacterium]
MKLKKLWDLVSTVLVVLVVALAVLLVGFRLLGYQVYNVVSGSMEPAYSVGDLLYVKPVDPYTVQVGDPITFVLNENLVVATHRVVAIDPENQLFQTKGDANEHADAAPVHFNNLIGIPKFHIPKLGYISDYVQNPPGTYIAIAFCAVLLAAVFLPDLIFGDEEEEEQPEDGETPKTVDNQPQEAENDTQTIKNQEASQ